MKYWMFFASLSLMFLGCAEVKDDSGLTLSEGFPKSMRQGDTSDVAVAVKKARNAAGRMETTNPFTDFTLISGDTSIIRIFENRRLIGVGSGSVNISAKENKGTLTSPQYPVVVSKIIGVAH